MRLVKNKKEPTSTEIIPDQKTVQFLLSNDNTLFKQLKYNSDIIDHPKTNSIVQVDIVILIVDMRSL